MASIMKAVGEVGIVNTVVGGGVSYAIGRTYAQYGKTNWAARNSARIAAIAGKGLAVVSALLGAPDLVVGGINAGGQAGVDAMVLEWGLKAGRKAIGKRAVLIDEKAALPTGGSEVGRLDKARAGAAPSWDQIAAMANAV